MCNYFVTPSPLLLHDHAKRLELLRIGVFENNHYIFIIIIIGRKSANPIATTDALDGPQARNPSRVVVRSYLSYPVISGPDWKARSVMVTAAPAIQNTEYHEQPILLDSVPGDLCSLLLLTLSLLLLVCCAKKLNEQETFLAEPNSVLFNCDPNQPHASPSLHPTPPTSPGRPTKGSVFLITECEVRAGPDNQLPGLDKRCPEGFIIVSPGLVCFYILSELQ